MTPCGHNFCEGCIVECINRKHVCPCCNHEVTKTQLVKNHHLDNLLATINREKEEASKRYFSKLINQGTTIVDGSDISPSPATSSSSAGMSPIEELFQKHMKRSLLAYKEYYKDMKKKYKKTEELIREECIDACQQLEKQVDLRKSGSAARDRRIEALRLECNNRLEALAHSFQQASAHLLAAYDKLATFPLFPLLSLLLSLPVVVVFLFYLWSCVGSPLSFALFVDMWGRGYANGYGYGRDWVCGCGHRYLSESVPVPSFLPVEVSVVLPSHSIRVEKVTLKPTDGVREVRRILEQRLRDLGNPLTSFSSSAYFVLSSPLEGGEQIILDDQDKPITQYKAITPGSEIILKGDFLLESDKPKECFTASFQKGANMTCDYFTCKDCKFNWICQTCATECHKGHQLVPYISNHKANWACCYCMKNRTCKIPNAKTKGK
jgi:hypothetical protein